MAERSGDFEWRAEGDEAEVVLYAKDDSALERILPATRLPGVESPVYSVATSHNFGYIIASYSHVASDLISASTRGMLLTTGTSVDNLGVSVDELAGLMFRNLSEVTLPRLDGSGVRRVCESGAWISAESGIIEEEDLQFFDANTGDPDSLGRRALTVGGRELDLLAKVRLYVVEDIQDSESAERLDLEPESIVLSIEAGAGDLGRLALAAHRERILGRIRAGIDFDADRDLPAAPLDSEEAADLLAASSAAENFADGRSARTLYALRRSLNGIVGEIRPVASWKVGGFEDRDGSMLHRRGLARVSEGEALVCGGSVASGKGALRGSAPIFDVPEQEGSWMWEESGLLDRLAKLEELK